MKSLRLLLLLLSATDAARQTPTTRPPTTDDQGGGLLRALRSPIVAGVGVGATALLALPRVREAASRLLRGGDEDLLSADGDEGSSAPPEDAEGSAEASGSSGQGLVLSPERLTVISERSALLQPMAEQLAAVPVFMVTLGNSTTPLSVRAPDGRRLAYFFLEFADADLFRRKILEQRQGEFDAQVAALSLADVVRAYGTDAAAEAKENFVVIPTMKAVLAARNLLKAKGDDETKWESKLSAASGLVPVFWIQALASQSASGKQRKIIFFRPEDAINMWANISAAQGEDAQMPTEPPELLVADLQTLSAHLTKGNKTDDVIFAPSSSALRIFARPQGGAGGPDGEADEDEMQQSRASASGAGGEGAAAGESDASQGSDSSGVAGSEFESEEEEEEEEEE